MKYIPKTQTRHHYDLVQTMISDLLGANKTNYVQTFGYELRGSHFSSIRLNFMNKNLLISSNFEKILGILGENIMEMILYNFYVKII